MEKRTTLFNQFNELKEKHPDRVLIFRRGDFYELYQQDADTATQTLGITKCERRVNGKHVRVANFALHALDMHLRRLIRSGHRCAICTQIA